MKTNPAQKQPKHTKRTKLIDLAYTPIPIPLLFIDMLL